MNMNVFLLFPCCGLASFGQEAHTLLKTTLIKCNCSLTIYFDNSCSLLWHVGYPLKTSGPTVILEEQIGKGCTTFVH